ncbi:hypothetical protein [Pseudoalteromonas ostreae]|uniref:hypothetical protein n=1 Tax=Pseudoalteromonas ostreae TaxID=2774154 RepID=UPI001B3582E5|nr:hypothetical protein [Pseudoalteromonas ostreae]
MNIDSLYGANLVGQPIAILAFGTGAVAARLSADGETKLIGGSLIFSLKTRCIIAYSVLSELFYKAID